MLNPVLEAQQFDAAQELLSHSRSAVEHAKGIQLLEKNVQLGDPLSMIRLAHLYKTGAFTEQNSERAVYLAMSAHDLCKQEMKNDPNQMSLLLGHLYYVGLGVRLCLDTARVHLEKSAKYNNPHAKYLLALIYFYDKVAVYNPRLAVEYFEEGAKQNIPYIQCELGDAYSKIGEYEKARLWYQKSDGLNYGKAACRLGEDCLYDGQYQRAYLYFRTAASSGYPDAFAFVGLCYQFGFECQEDKFKAEEWYEKGLKFNSLLAKLLLQVHKLTIDPPKDIKVFKTPDVTPYFSGDPNYQFNYTRFIKWCGEDEKQGFLKAVSAFVKAHQVLGDKSDMNEAFESINNLKQYSDPSMDDVHQSLKGVLLKRLGSEIESSRDKNIKLDLQNADISFVVMIQLLKVALKQSKIIDLNFSGNKLNDRNLKDLVKFLQADKPRASRSHFAKLKSLDLSNNMLTNEGGKQVLKLSTGFETLGTVNLSSNEIDKSIVDDINKKTAENSIKQCRVVERASSMSSYAASFWSGRADSINKTKQVEEQASSLKFQQEIMDDDYIRLLNGEFDSNFLEYAAAYDSLNLQQKQFIKQFLDNIILTVNKCMLAKPKVISYYLLATEISIAPDGVRRLEEHLLQGQLNRPALVNASQLLNGFTRMERYCTRINLSSEQDVSVQKWQAAVRYCISQLLNLTCAHVETLIRDVSSSQPMLA